MRARKKLKSDEVLVTSYPATSLRVELAPVPLCCGDHLAVRRPVEYFARYLYLPCMMSRDASRIADEVIVHLSGLMGAKVRVTLEVEADIPDGAPDQVVRTVIENGRTLKFTSLGFEPE